MILFPNLYGENGGSVGLVLSNSIEEEDENQLVKILDELTALKKEDLSAHNQSLDAKFTDLKVTFLKNATKSLPKNTSENLKNKSA